MRRMTRSVASWPGTRPLPNGLALSARRNFAAGVETPYGLVLYPSSVTPTLQRVRPCTLVDDALGRLATDLEVGERSGMKVRLLQDEDLEETIAVWHQTRKATHTSMNIETERGLTLEDSQRIFRENIAPHCQLWVAESRDTVVGFLAIRKSYIDRMYVEPSDQRRGVGTALLEKARELSPAGLELHTHQENRHARTFYEKHGFRAVRFGVSPPPENEPDVEYRWRPA